MWIYVNICLGKLGEVRLLVVEMLPNVIPQTSMIDSLKMVLDFWIIKNVYIIYEENKLNQILYYL